MRKITAGLFITLDGVVEAPEKWSRDYASPEIDQAIGASLAQADAMLLGRVTYETFAASFAGQTGGIADAMNGMPKFVVSKTLRKTDWQNSELIKGNVREEVLKLKQQPGRNIGISGSTTLVRWLLGEGLLDELTLVIVPLVLGSGKRLFAQDGDRVSLKLADSKTTKTGVLITRYERAD
jgi:dihydrofolate reductase